MGAAAGLPLAFVALLAVEAVLAGTIEPIAHPDYEVDTTVAPRQGWTGDRTLRMVMLGDSTVAGLGAPTAAESLAVQTAQRVADRTGMRVAVVGHGVSGARTADLVEQQIPRLIGAAADVVVVVIGSNDATHATPVWRFDDHTRAVLEAVEHASEGAPMVLGGVPLFGSATALAQPLRWVVDQYAKPLRGIQRRVAAEQDITFVNIAVEASPRFRGVPEAMSADRFHPAPVGYGFWADALAAAVAAEFMPDP